tara:strand:+ start:926 stop:1354 length:429 start_codon:yes stop_codon:yes gene_type:complete
MSDTKNVWHRSAKTIGIETREIGELSEFLNGQKVSMTIEAVAMDNDNIGYEGMRDRQTLSESINEYNTYLLGSRVYAWIEYEKIGGINASMERYDNHRRAALKLAKYYQIKFADIHGVANNAGNGYNWILLGYEYDMGPRKD